MFADFEDHLEYFFFIGQIVGKALYDRVLIPVQFANFFMKAVQGRYNYGQSLPVCKPVCLTSCACLLTSCCSVDDLLGLDPQVYKNLLFLKTYDGDVKDMELNFSVDNVILGKTVTTDLIPNGRNVPVTKENRMRFIYLMADYRLNKQIKQQSMAFLQGCE